MSLLTKDVLMSWGVIRPLFSIRNESEYDRAIERLNALIDEVGTDEENPLYELLDTLGIVIHTYEEKNYPMPDSNGVEMMHFFDGRTSIRVSRSTRYWDTRNDFGNTEWSAGSDRKAAKVSSDKISGITDNFYLMAWSDFWALHIFRTIKGWPE